MKIASVITLQPAYMRPANAARYVDLPKEIIMRGVTDGHITAFWLKSRYHPSTKRAMCLISRESLIHFIEHYSSFYPADAEGDSLLNAACLGVSRVGEGLRQEEVTKP